MLHHILVNPNHGVYIAVMCQQSYSRLEISRSYVRKEATDGQPW